MRATLEERTSLSMTIASRVGWAMESRGVNSLELSRMSGVSATTIQSMARYDVTYVPNCMSLKLVADALGVTCGWILGEEHD